MWPCWKEICTDWSNIKQGIFYDPEVRTKCYLKGINFRRIIYAILALNRVIKCHETINLAISQKICSAKLDLFRYKDCTNKLIFFHKTMLPHYLYTSLCMCLLVQFYDYRDYIFCRWNALLQVQVFLRKISMTVFHFTLFRFFRSSRRPWVFLVFLLSTHHIAKEILLPVVSP